MESNHSMSTSQREFYLPASPLRSTVPSRLERFVTVRLSDHSGLQSTPSIRAAGRAFYLPATAGRNGR